VTLIGLPTAASEGLSILKWPFSPFSLNASTALP
jgi:hypothetical protein